MKILIRNCKIEDLDQIKRLALSAWLNAYRGIYSEKDIFAENEKYYTREFHQEILESVREGHHLFKVLEVENSISGLMDFHFDEDRTWPMRFYLHPSLIGKGLGTLMLREAEKELSGLDRKGYFLLVHRRNQIGLRFYERNQFERFPKYAQEKDEEICFRKQVQFD